MWKPIAGLSLLICAFAFAQEPHNSDPPLQSVSVECHGRLRQGVVAIGGETTGTTITFNGMMWELDLKDDAQQEFGKKHHKGTVTATGTLRKIAGTESKVRLIVDVKTLSERDAKAVKEGTVLTVLGTLRETTPRPVGAPEMTIEAAGQVWPLDLSAEAKLPALAKSLVGQTVLLAGSVEQDNDDEPSAAAFIRVKTLELPTKAPVKE